MASLPRMTYPLDGTWAVDTRTSAVQKSEHTSARMRRRRDPSKWTRSTGTCPTSRPARASQIQDAPGFRAFLAVAGGRTYTAKVIWILIKPFIEGAVEEERRSFMVHENRPREVVEVAIDERKPGSARIPTHVPLTVPGLAHLLVSVWPHLRRERVLTDTDGVGVLPIEHELPALLQTSIANSA